MKKIKEVKTPNIKMVDEIVKEVTKRKSVEQDLLEIKQCKIDMLILQRANDKLCETNNNEIGRLAKVIEGRETLMEGKLKTSGEKKIETTAGYVSFNKMPDKWEYDTTKLIEWAKKNSSDEFKERYVKVTEELKKAEIKKDILRGFLLKELPGVTVTTQDPKFGYKLKGGLL